MKDVYTPKKKKPRIHNKFVYTYEVYERKYLYDENASALFVTEDPFLAYWKASNLSSYTDNYVLVTHITKFVHERFDYDCAQQYQFGGSMQIQNAEDYDTVVLYTDNPKEFFTENLRAQYPKFNLWQVTRDKHKGYIIDFTLKSDSVIILSTFGNRLHMRLDRGPDLIEDPQRDSLMYKAHFAIVWKDEKNNFF